jgi:type I restriction enzyme S subunit
LSEGLNYIATKDISYESVINYDNGIKIPDEDKSSFKIASSNRQNGCLLVQSL